MLVHTILDEEGVFEENTRVHEMQDFAKYRTRASTNPAEAQWMPEIPSLALGAALGSIFTIMAMATIDSDATPAPNLSNETELLAEQLQSQTVKFEFYDVLKKR